VAPRAAQCDSGRCARRRRPRGGPLPGHADVGGRRSRAGVAHPPPPVRRSRAAPAPTPRSAATGCTGAVPTPTTTPELSTEPPLSVGREGPNDGYDQEPCQASG
jgi:hypothetical protein